MNNNTYTYKARYNKWVTCCIDNSSMTCTGEHLSKAHVPTDNTNNKQSKSNTLCHMPCNLSNNAYCLCRIVQMRQQRSSCSSPSSWRISTPPEGPRENRSERTVDRMVARQVQDALCFRALGHSAYSTEQPRRFHVYHACNKMGNQEGRVLELHNRPHWPRECYPD